MTLAVGGCESSARRPTICNGPPCALFKRYTQAGESKLAHLRVISFIFASLSGGRRLKPHKPSPTFAGRDWQRGRNRIRAETYIQQHTEQRTAVLAILVHGRQCKRQVNGRWDNSGIRSLSKFHQQHPYVFNVGGQEYRVDYLPAESNTGMFGGNSNWRGPIWMPVNALIIRALQNFYLYYGATRQSYLSPILLEKRTD
jgi:hypothetical protein